MNCLHFDDCGHRVRVRQGNPIKVRGLLEAQKRLKRAVRETRTKLLNERRVDRTVDVAVRKSIFRVLQN